MDKSDNARKQFLKSPVVKMFLDASVEGIYELAEHLFKGKSHGLLLCATFLFEISEQLARLAQAAVLAHDEEQREAEQLVAAANEQAQAVIQKARQS